MLLVSNRCMAEWSSLSVRESTRDRFNEEREEFNENQDDGLPDVSQDQFLKMLLDTLEHAQDGRYAKANSDSIDTDEIAAKIVDAMEGNKGVKIEHVEIDDSGTTMDRSDVENIVESWVERNYDRLRKGEL